MIAMCLPDKAKKTCTICKAELPATTEYFFKEKRGKYGLRSKCKPCYQAGVKILKAKPSYRKKAIEHGRKYYQKNKTRFADRWQAYYAANRRHLINKIVEKAKADPAFRLNQNISRAIRGSLFAGAKHKRKWETIVGYTLAGLRKHLEKQFQPGMTWDNYGKWHIDHEIPISAFNFTKPEHEDFVRCWSLNNLRPMWAKENISKGARLEKPFQPRLQLEVT